MILFHLSGQNPKAQRGQVNNLSKVAWLLSGRLEYIKPDLLLTITV